MRTAVIPAEEKQFDQAFLIRDEFSVVYHPEDFLFGCPAHSLYLLCLQMKRPDINLPRQEIIVIKTVLPMNGQRRTDIRQIERETQFLTRFPFRGGPTGISGYGAAAHRDIPKIRPAVFERLPLLDQHSAFRIKNADMNNKPVEPFRRRLTPDHLSVCFPPCAIRSLFVILPVLPGI